MTDTGPMAAGTGGIERPATPSMTGRGAFRVALPFPLRAAITPALTVAAIVIGGLLHLPAATERGASAFMLVALIALGAPVILRTLAGLLRGEFAADVVAMLAIATAIVLREPLAGLIIVLMQTGGELLERYAEGRASNAVRELEAAAPRIAHRLTSGSIEDVAADRIAAGDRILVRPGEMIPADGTVSEGTSSLDTSRVTGEPLPERVIAGSEVRSGVVNLQGPLVITVTKPASESLYARIVELVRTAQAEKAPIQRLADRWAVWFTPVTLAACAVAWGLSGDASRVLAVLVVATPCPLLLATPVAIIGGINRAARRQVIIRHGTALEQLAKVDVAVFDKTGTLTIGRPEVAAVQVASGDEATLLRLAAAVEVGSGHLLGRSVVAAAMARGLEVPRAREIRDFAGRGVSGIVDGVRVTVGSASLIAELHPEHASQTGSDATAREGLRAFVVAGDETFGTIDFADRPREGLKPFFARLHALGLRRLVLLSGDHAANVAPVARALGIDEAKGDLLPEGKVDAVKALEREGHRVMMVGDGTNDAPALSSASVGVALAAHGGGFDLVGFTGSGMSHTGWRNFEENVPERAARLVHARKMPPVIIVFPDCFTALGGNQYINSSAIGRYADYLTRELVPFVDRELRTRAGREHRGCFGKSSGGYGSIVHGMKYARCWGAVASHSGDAYFDFVYRSDWPRTLDELAKHRRPPLKAGRVAVRGQAASPGHDDGRVRRFLEHFWRKDRPNDAEVHCLMNLAMAASYDPDPRAPNGFYVPFDLETGELVRARWRRWLAHDPVNLVARHARSLRTLRGIFVDCGWRDQYHIHYGSRLLSQRLTAHGVAHRYEEFDGTHSGIDYRMDVSLPFLARALS